MIDLLNYLYQYLLHLLKVRSKFQIHSPFVFNFYKYVLGNTTRYPDYEQIETVRKNLLSRARFIKRVDLGARSIAFPYSQRFARVRDIARKSSVSEKKGQLLYKLVKHYKPRSIIELGTAFGISTMYMAMAYPNCHIYTVEGCSDTLYIATHNFSRLGLGNIQEICGNFDELLPKILARTETVDLVFIDGNHKKEATLRYFDECLAHVHNNTIFVFDDIHWSKGMRSAWENIRQHPSVRVSIDLFTIGLVFFRNELSKEDFILRF
ncbi:MAG: SAM-dependent methyltransferase [Bacteroidetes bacterium]|nr:MAG: SAM-dependent methyltransferase [Bacteroidota bacterium]